MKQAEKLIQEINRKIEAVNKTKSKQLKYHYGKSVERDIKQLKQYCLYKNLKYSELAKRIGWRR